ncbi:histidine phosphatase family protein [Alloalcanivorax marinus]|uniref:histidine phosphatase family protein n=1 Tax=Alloalcanivorax marinus TaxID=1177169 RepID=UPI0021CF492E|nr:histidine phosphatase family protein [Alloalcanivorax marinus]MCU5785715.1 phosphoglycerate mutase [Alloalcanivorax marinus]
MAEFYLVRHGQASFGADNYDKLSQLGHQQARWLGEYYRERGLDFDALVTGDLVRHVETGAGILEGLGTHLAADVQPGLNEFDFHSIVDAYLSAHPDQAPPEGAPIAAFYRVLKRAMQRWQADGLEGALPERWAGFQARVAGAMAHIQERYADRRRVLVVSSGGAIAMWMRHMLDTADDTVVELNLQIRNTGVTQGFFNDKVFRLSVFNQVPHLDRQDRSDSITYS